MEASPIKIVVLTALALISFAANSVLCRLALDAGAIDAASFTLVRMIAGIVVLWLLVLGSGQGSRVRGAGSWRGAISLFGYAVAFSFAYLSLDTGTGALILFGTVQLTMLVATLLGGQRLYWVEWAGLFVAVGGFAYLMLPGASAPSPYGFAVMLIAGISWAVYTLSGRGSKAPLKDTYANFVRTGPLLVPLLILAVLIGEYSTEGIFYAVLSGALASGVGYALWYGALRGLTGLQAGVLQLLVPVIAALGGVVFASEVLTERLIVSAFLILGGILAVVVGGSLLRRSAKVS